MAEKLNQLLGSREARNAARATFETRLASVRAELTARGIAVRVADKVVADAKAAALQGADIARESKGIIAGTVAALALWFMRGPIISWLEKLLGDTVPAENEDTSND